MSSTDWLHIAVVGHTNAGKTSLLRTLLQRRDFGQVAASPSTTRDVMCTEMILTEQFGLALYDTPGLEQGSELFDLLNSEFTSEAYRHDGPKQLTALLNSTSAQFQFDQEAKVIRQLMKCDAAFYVIDVRDPVLPKLQDELSLLSRCGRPLIAVLNFTEAANQQLARWREALAKVHIHQQVSFDAVAPPEDGANQLFESLAVVLPHARAALKQALTNFQQQQDSRRRQAYLLVADLLIDVAAYQRLLPVAEQQQVAEAISAMQQQVRQREQLTLQSILMLYGFTEADAVFDLLAIAQGQWQDDLFAAETLKAFGIKTGLGLGTGAAAGAGIDVFLGGASLGAAAAIGATVGGVYQGWQSLGKRLLNHWRGYQTLQVQDAIVALLMRRQQLLVKSLQRRGHAAQQPLQLEPMSPLRQLLPQHDLPVLLDDARHQPQWSSLNPEHYQPSRVREQACADLQVQLQRSY
jgi:GTPase Era involved in 16S rRNA processing